MTPKFHFCRYGENIYIEGGTMPIAIRCCGFANPQHLKKVLSLHQKTEHKTIILT